MKKKQGIIFCVVAIALLLTACGSKEVFVLEEELQSTLTLTVIPTVTTAPTPLEAVQEESGSEEKDTYIKGVLTEDGFSSEWMNLRFTCQPGFIMGAQDGQEMFVQSVDGAQIVVQTKPLQGEYARMQEVIYIGRLTDDLRNSAGEPEVTVEELYETKIGGEDYIGTWVRADYEDGHTVWHEYIVRKKESRMIDIELIYTDESVKGIDNLMKCFGSYDSEPIYLSEEALAPSVFESGVVTENGYENEWLNLRITLPEGVTMTKQDMGPSETIFMNIEWKSGNLMAQFTVDNTPGMTTKEYLNSFLEYMKNAIASTENGQGIEIIQEDELQVAQLGGQEYLKLHLSMKKQDELVHYDYYSRMQDDYAVSVVIAYKDDLEAEAKEVLNFFSTY